MSQISSSEGRVKAKEQVEQLARNIIEMIEQGNVRAYEQEWKETGCSLPMNYVTKHRYTGCNFTLLSLYAWRYRWDDQRFVTIKQLEELTDDNGDKAELAPVATPCAIVRPFMFKKKIPVEDDQDISEIPEEKLETDEEGNLFRVEERVCFKQLRVYNVTETTAKIEPLAKLDSRTWQDVEFFDHVVNASGIRLFHGGNRAFYNCTEDFIRLPVKDAFETAASYYGTLMHEFFHATGSKNRFDRDSFSRFGDEKYALDELRAELFAVVCQSVFGLEKTLDNSAAYLDSWRSAVEDGKAKVILKAVADVEKVVSVMIDIAYGDQPQKAPWFPPIDFSIMPTPLKDLAFHQSKMDEAGFMESRTAAREMETPDALAHRVLSNAFDMDNHLAVHQVGETLFGMPPLNGTDKDGDEAVAHLHMTGAAGEDVYLTEFDPGTGRGFGWVSEDGDVFNGSCRFIETDEMATMHEVDLRFEPTSLREVILALEEKIRARCDNTLHESMEWDGAGEEPFDSDEAYFSPRF